MIGGRIKRKRGLTLWTFCFQIFPRFYFCVFSKYDLLFNWEGSLRLISQFWGYN